MGGPRAVPPGLGTGCIDGEAGTAARVSMTDFLSGLQVRVADRFSLSPNSALDDFEVVPFDGQRLERDEGAADAAVSEEGAELAGEELHVFQARVRDRGALPAYRLGPSNYLVIDGVAAPALEVMARMQRAPASERADFIRNPRPHITEAVVASLREQGRFEGLSDAAAEELIEQTAGPLFLETAEFSDRVVGLKVFEKSLATGVASAPVGYRRPSPNNWRRSYRSCRWRNWTPSETAWRPRSPMRRLRWRWPASICRRCPKPAICWLPIWPPPRLQTGGRPRMRRPPPSVARSCWMPWSISRSCAGMQP